tara:strand:- start:737 stop:1534 length:798 start_codon:yes stop_codon:yes gene_type:complete
MPTKENKPIATTWKNDLTINQSTNTGVDATVRAVQDGAGNNSALSLGTRNVAVTNTTHDSTTAFIVTNKDSENILTVDTTNSKVLVGASQVAANTNYAHFGVSSELYLPSVVGTHYVVPFGNPKSSTAYITLGTGTDPATTFDVSANNSGDDLTVMLWYIIDNITIDAVHWFSGGDAASGDVINVHLMSYTIDTGNGSTSGDLSAGVVVADGDDVTSLGYENVVYQSATVQSANVDAGKVCLFTFEGAGTNSDYAISANIKYHIR